MSIGGLVVPDLLLYAVLIASEALAVALLVGARRRRTKLAAAGAWTEPLDLETLRRRMRIVDPDPPRQLPQTRQLLDELRRREPEDRSAGTGGVAGSSRRR